MVRRALILLLASSASLFGGRMPGALAQEGDLAAEAKDAMRRAAKFFRHRVAVRGGYVYYYSLDFKERWGEGRATADEICLQPPGTPTVGLAYLAAYRATQDKLYLDAARATGSALLYGQLASGGWAHSINFDPHGERTARYRRGDGRGRNFSTLDDNSTQSALRFLMQLDQTLEFRDDEVREAVQFALDALLEAQFPAGGFPQVWSGPVSAQPAVKASFPDYDWKTEHRVKEYWNFYTLNDGLCGDVADVLLDGWRIYRDQRCRKALVKLGDFLLLAQMPEPQPAWAQQYDYAMHPVWARKFEPPAISGLESQDALATLLKVYRETGDAKYLAPLPAAIAYLKASRLPDGRLARFYELQTNRPLYMTRDYRLTYDDGDAPAHYGWKVGAGELDRIERIYAELKDGRGRRRQAGGERTVSADRVREIIAQLDGAGRWVSRATGQRLAGQPKFGEADPFISSAVFSRNLEALSAFVAAPKK